MTWSKEMRTMFEKLFPTHSYGGIMNTMNRAFPGADLTRSAICGHAWRNGFKKGRPKPQHRAKNVARPTRKKLINANALKAAELREQQADLGIEEPTEEMAEGTTLLDQPCWRGTMEATVALDELNEATCRWPLRVDGCTEYRFCHNTKGRGAYCLAHASLSYNPARERRAADNKPHYRPSGVRSSAVWGR